MTYLPKCTQLLLFLSIAFTSCQNADVSAEDDPQEEIVIVERKDTIVSFDPETMEESIQVVTSYDTIISYDSGKGK